MSNINGDLDSMQIYGIDEDANEMDCQACDGWGWDCADCWGTGKVVIDQ